MKEESKKETGRNRRLINKVHLLGEILTKPVLAYEKYGEIFFISTIKVERIEGVTDEITVLIPREYAEGIKVGDFVETIGKTILYNTKDSKGRALSLCVKTKKIKKINTKPVRHINEVTIMGYVKKKISSKIVSNFISYAYLILAMKDINKKNINVKCYTFEYATAIDMSELKKGQLVKIEGQLNSNILSDGNIAYEVNAFKVTRQ